MDAVIVDTNVIVIANDTDDKRADCRDHCQDRLQQIIEQNEQVVVDDEWRIFGEYEDNTYPNTKKGIGDLFVKGYCKIRETQTSVRWCISHHWLETGLILKNFLLTPL